MARSVEAYVAPDGRWRVRDLGGELVVGTGDVVPKVEGGYIRTPAAFAGLGDVTEDAREAAPGRPSDNRGPPTSHGARRPLNLAMFAQNTDQVVVVSFSPGETVSDPWRAV